MTLNNELRAWSGCHFVRYCHRPNERKTYGLNENLKNFDQFSFFFFFNIYPKPLALGSPNKKKKKDLLKEKAFALNSFEILR